MNTVYNFGAGPSMLPQEVLSQAKKELKNWNQLGVSIMEISHRSENFIQIALEAEQDLRDLLNIPESYKILFCQGGARGQFSAVPMNLSNNIKSADYINSGYWSQCAEREAKKYCNVKSINIKKKIIIILLYCLFLNGILVNFQSIFIIVPMKPCME